MRKTHVLDRETGGGDDAAAEASPATPADPPPSPGPGGGNGLTRVTVNLNRQAIQALEQVSAATGYTKTDTINRAIQIYAIVQEIMERDQGTIRVMHRDGEIEKIYII